MSHTVWPRLNVQCKSLSKKITKQRQIQEFALGGPSPLLSLPSPPIPFPPSPLLPSFRSEVGPLKPAWRSGEHCKLPQQGLGQNPGRKRIWCTQKLWESHWWHSFRVFWSAFFTVDQSKFSTRHNTVLFSLIRSTTTASVRRPKGAGAAGSRPNPPLLKAGNLLC